MIMATYLGIRTEYNPFWKETKGLSDLEKMYNVGHEDGYSKGFDVGMNDLDSKTSKIEKENETLKAHWEANLRILREEIKKEKYINVLG